MRWISEINQWNLFITSASGKRVGKILCKLLDWGFLTIEENGLSFAETVSQNSAHIAFQGRLIINTNSPGQYTLYTCSLSGAAKLPTK